MTDIMETRSTSTTDEIRQNEEQIFHCLDIRPIRDPNKVDIDLSSQSKNLSPMFARSRARQQLSTSADNPFSFLRDKEEQEYTEEELNRLREERARLLREETEDIKEQLDLVKTRLCELRTKRKQNHELQEQLTIEQSHQVEDDYYPYENLRQQNKSQQTSKEKEEKEANGEIAIQTGETENVDQKTSNNWNQKLRPLTGKADCPNCSCDRRHSVCDKCIRFASTDRPLNSSKQIQENAPPKQAFDYRRPSFFWRHDTELREKSHQAQQQVRHTPNSSFDERPIRPAAMYRHPGLDGAEEDGNNQSIKDRLNAKVEICVDHQVVPNRIYTIGKSLNEKRSKLAEAIEELKTMTDKVKQRGDRLEEERKVARLYKDQWRFGPSIGGNTSKRISTNQGGKYSSKLDPNLARDTNSLMGFRNIEPTMQLRQYSNRNALTIRSIPPKPRPRFTKMAAQTVASRAKMVNSRVTNYLRTSRSLESLRPNSTKSTLLYKQRTGINSKVKTVNLEHPSDSPRKSASETNLATPVNSPDAIEEVIEEEIREEDTPDEKDTETGAQDRDAHKSKSPEAVANQGTSNEQPKSLPPGAQINQEEPILNQNNKVQRLSWIPVFGETEIKTVTKRTPKRKIHVLPSLNEINQKNKTISTKQTVIDGSRDPRKTASILRPSRPSDTINKSRASNERKRSNSSDRVLNEASRRLQFANQLLEQEKLDSVSKNQVLIERNFTSSQPGPAPRLQGAPKTIAQSDSSLGRAKSSVNLNQCGRQLRPPSSCKNSDEDLENCKNSAKISEASKEIHRLEQMISEQQRLLSELAVASQNVDLNCHQESRVSRMCSCPCCLRKDDSPNTAAIKTRMHSPHCTLSNHSVAHRAHLSHHLREKLAKTKARLAKALEEEKAKHHKLEQKVDSSLRKQTDLQNENELLKKSLSKCIDTCLKDISSTFESLSDTLNDSILANPLSSPSSRQHLVLDTGDCKNQDDNDREHQDLDTTDNSAATLHNISNTTSSNSTIDETLTNAAKLIADNQSLKRLKAHIEAIERQRRSISEELNGEKQRNKMLEIELSKSKEELSQLMAATQQLVPTKSTDEQQSHSKDDEPGDDLNSQEKEDKRMGGSQSKPRLETGTDCSSSKAFLDEASTSQAKSFSEENSSTFNSIDLYRQYIQSMTPDLDAIRRERQVILSEFDNIKKMLIDMDK